MVWIVGEKAMTDLTKWPGFSKKWLRAYWGKGVDIYQEKSKCILKIPLSRKASSQWVLTKNLIESFKRADYRAYTHKKDGGWHFLDVLNTVVWFKHQEKKFCFVLSLRTERKTDLPHEQGLAWYVVVTPAPYKTDIPEIPLKRKPNDKSWLEHLFGH